jgi:hypothetical protein
VSTGSTIISEPPVEILSTVLMTVFSTRVVKSAMNLYRMFHLKCNLNCSSVVSCDNVNIMRKTDCFLFFKEKLTEELYSRC